MDENKKTLIIAEKPSLCMNIVSAIGNMARKDGYYENRKYIVSFSFGHLFELKTIDQYLNRGKTAWSMKELPFIPNPFEFRLKDNKGVKKQYKVLKDLIARKDVTTIVNAGDADREGEVIINNIIYKAFNELGQKKDVKRLWLKAQNTEGIQKALIDIKPIVKYDNLYQEGLARAYSDWLYGINLTRYLTLKASDGRGALTVGRVVTPVVKFIYDRDIAIKNFAPEKYIEIDAIIAKDGRKIKTAVKNARFKVEQKEEAEALFALLSNQTYYITEKKIKKVEKQPRKLFSLTTLQNLMSSKYKMNLDETLDVVQNLYENGYVSYPRTNTEYLTSSEKEDVRKLIDYYREIVPYNLEFKDKKSVFDDSKVESHSALLPTKKIPGMLGRQEKLIYDHIFQRFLANFIADKVIVEQTIIKIELGYDRYIELRGEVFDHETVQLPELEYPYVKDPLPYFEEGEYVKIRFELANKETNPPQKVTLEELNNWLKNPFRKEIKNKNDEENKGIENADDEKEYGNILNGLEIGTVATRDAIIKKAENCGYIENKKTVLSITEKGEYIIKSLEKLGVNLTKEKTVQLSCSLKKIYKGEMQITDLIQEVSDELNNTINRKFENQSVLQELYSKAFKRRRLK